MTPYPVLALLLAPLLALTAPPVAPTSPWLSPVAPLIVERPFAAPPGPYASGHRGVDLVAARGATVRAPAPGIVRFAGTVAGKAVVSIEHPGRILGRTGWRTTYEGVRGSVGIGDRLHAGDPIGIVIGHEHSAGFHWGLKNGRVYADPLMMLRRPVVLKPLGD